MTEERSAATRTISANDLHVIMTQCLDAAKEIHIAMCLFDDNHFAQRNLNDAMHAALVGATQCLHLHRSDKHRLAEVEPEINGELGEKSSG